MLETILKTIIDNGFTAYIVGGYVRDDLLGLDPIDVDICTNAREKDLMWMFKSAIGVKEYGAVKIKQGKYNIDITTFRKDEDYKDGKPLKITYTDSLECDLMRRDFTINAMCYDYKFNLIDPLNGKKDLENKFIRVIGDTKTRFDEDPLRILRALRFMSTLDFTLDKSILEYLKNNKEKLSNINYSKRKLELDKIFSSKGLYKFISICKKYDLEQALGIKFKSVIRTGYSIGIWSQITCDEEYNFTKQEKQQIEDIRKIVNYGKINKYTIYKYGKYVSLIASSILGTSQKKVNRLYSNLAILERKDIDITADEICDVLKIEPSEKLGIYFKKLEKMIVYGKIENRKEVIIKYLEKERSKHERVKK